MADNDDLAGILPPEVDTPLVPVTEPDAPPAEEPEEAVEGDEDGEEEVLETIEVEIGGKKFIVPKAVEEHLLREEDYTQKTQAIAEERRAIEAHQERAREAAQVQEAVLEDIAAIRSIDAQIQEYNRIDWPAYHLQNPQAAGYHYMQFQELQGHRNRAAYSLNEKMQHVSTKQAEAKSQAIDRAITALQKPDPEYGWPGYSAAHMDRLTEDAKREFNFTDQQLQRVVDPGTIKALNCAVLWKRAMRQAAAKQKSTTVEAQPVKQIPSNRGRSTSSTPSDKDSTEEWVAKERRRMAAKHAANGSGLRT